MVVETYEIFLSAHTQYLTFRCVEHVLRLDKDSCWQIVLYNLVSSAYIAEEPSDMTYGRSLMKTTNSNGPKRLPCGNRRPT